MPKLCVNIDHIATLREAKKGRDPDPIAAAVLIELAGGQGISAHLREDRHHIQERDIKLLRQTLSTNLNLVMAPTTAMVQFAIDTLPDMVTLVPENSSDISNENGLNMLNNQSELEKMISSLKMHDIFVSVFIEPDITQIKAAKKIGASCIEINTHKYTNAYDFGEDDMGWQVELDKIEKTTQMGKKSDLVINVGSGLNYNNIHPIASILDIDEINIGHAIISRAALVGLQKAVSDMVNLIQRK